MRITKKAVADIINSYYEEINNLPYQKNTFKALEIKYTVTEELGKTVINIAVTEELIRHFTRTQKTRMIEKTTYHYIVEDKELLDNWYETIRKF